MLLQWDDEAAGNRVSLTLLKNLPREEFPDELSDINFGKVKKYLLNIRK